MSTHTPGRQTAYLVSQYPAYSHVFIEREVRGLRSLGWSVLTVSVNSPGVPGHPESANTLVVKSGGYGSSLLKCLRFAFSHPVGFFTGLTTALQNGLRVERKSRAMAWQLFYLAEAILVWTHLRQRGVRHLHAHFANNAADIARLVVPIGNAVEPTRWSWSMAVHGPTDFRLSRQLDLRGKVASASFVTCISRFALERLKQECGAAHWSKLHIVHMGVELDYAVAPAPQGPSTTQSEFRVLFVGRIVAEKAVSILLEAVRGLSEEVKENLGGVHIRLLLIGDGPLRPALESQYADLREQGVVEWAGAQTSTRVAEAYANADVFCLPSYSEGLPVVLMEALLAGLPVVATPIAGIPELVEHEVTGLLVETGSASSTRAALRRLLEDPELRHALGGAGRERVVREYSSEANAALLSHLIATAQDSLPREDFAQEH